MTVAGFRVRRALLVVAILAGVLGCREARAQAVGLTLSVNPIYLNGTTTQTDALGHEIRTWAQSLDQQYRLSLDANPYPLLRINVNGTADWTLGWSQTDGSWSDTSALIWNGQAVATLGNSVLNGSLGYSIQENSGWVRRDGPALSQPTVGRQSVTGNILWQPDQGAMAQLQAVHGHTYDASRALIDQYENDFYGLGQWTPLQPLTLRYSLTYAATRNEVTGIDQQNLRSSGFVSYADRFFSDRLSVFASYQNEFRTLHTTVSGPGGLIEVQRFPIQGLSLVEVPPTVPERNTLVSNPALIDGNLTVSAGIDLGYSVPDPNYRDVGVQFPDATSTVNAIYVWVDRQLPADVWGAFTWLAFTSDDNLNWTPVGLGGVPVFSPIFNRFEIPIASVQVRFLKVVTKPLLPGVTSDSRFASIFVTEIQVFERVPAGSLPRAISALSGTLTAGLTLRLVQSLNLDYQFSAFMTHTSGVGIPYYSIQNGLSLALPLSDVFRLAARIQRSDYGGVAQPTGATSLVTATVSADPVPAFGAAFTYSGSIIQGPIAGYGVTPISGTRLSNTAQLSFRADLYPGINLFGSASYTLITGGGLPDSPTLGASLSSTLQVNPKLSVTLSVTGTDTRGGPTGQPAQFARVDGTVTYSPFPALFVNAGGGYYVAGLGPKATAIVNAGFSPFPGNDLQFTFSVNDYVDTGQDYRNRFWGPALRWNFRRGSWLEASYIFYDTYTAALTTAARTLFLSLFISIG